MMPIFSLLLIVALSLLVTRAASVALEHTGLGRESARFQARSAFTGVGFTTSEAEDVVRHPVRRKIVGTLMLVGNAGLVAVVSSLLLTFLGDAGRAEVHLAALAVGLLLLWWLATSRRVDSVMCHIISWALTRFTDLDVSDYARLLHVREDYTVSQLRVGPESWLAHRSLRDCALRTEGIVVLGLECPAGSYIGAPSPNTEIQPGDTLILYGDGHHVRELEARSPDQDGDRAHAEAETRQSQRHVQECSLAGREA